MVFDNTVNTFDNLTPFRPEYLVMPFIHAPTNEREREIERELPKLGTQSDEQLLVVSRHPNTQTVFVIEHLLRRNA